MIRPLPPSQSWTGPVTAYARLLAEEGAGGEADGAPYAAWASDGGLPDGPEGEDGWASHEADRRLKSEAEGRGAKAVVPFPDALPPKDRGTVVHAVLEATDFAWDEGRYRAEALKAAASLGFRLSPEGAAALAGCLHRFQEGETGREVRDALASGRLVWREWPFWLRIDDDGRGRRPVTLSGTVDLLYMNAKDEAVLADYKLYRPADETVYRIQLGIYARALRQAGIAGDRIIERLCYLAG
jgi:ATP-dependent exoDNAse (exonuclease V) beta subunit